MAHLCVKDPQAGYGQDLLEAGSRQGLPRTGGTSARANGEKERAEHH